MTPLERFEANVERTDSCWLWRGYVQPSGYARFGVDGNPRYRVHRWAYEHFVGPIPEGLVLDHLCRVTHCVNPAHLEPVTSQENFRRGRRSSGTGPPRLTHCKRGHEFTDDNTLTYANKRACKTCHRHRDREWHRRKKLAEMSPTSSP